jgi:predicted GTPase
MGYSPTQRHELEETIRNVPCDLVIVATPIDLARVIKIDKPALRVTYEVKERTSPGLIQAIDEFSHRFKPALVEM